MVAGRLGGRPLVTPRGDDTRPTLDRVRAAMFDSLGERVHGCTVLDLYAGSGALGIEALSRGARSALFVETAGPALRALAHNIDQLKLGPLAETAAEPVARALRRLRAEGRRFDLVLADPPYVVPSRAFMAGAGAVLAPMGILVAERPVREGQTAWLGLRSTRRAVYGSTAVEFWQVEGSVEEAADARGVSGHL